MHACAVCVLNANERRIIWTLSRCSTIDAFIPAWHQVICSIERCMCAYDKEVIRVQSAHNWRARGQLVRPVLLVFDNQRKSALPNAARVCWCCWWFVMLFIEFRHLVVFGDQHGLFYLFPIYGCNLISYIAQILFKLFDNTNNLKNPYLIQWMLLI